MDNTLEYVQHSQTILCTNTQRHRDSVWVGMKIGQFEPPRRVTLYCPECGSSISVDGEFRHSALLSSI